MKCDRCGNECEERNRDGVCPECQMGAASPKAPAVARKQETGIAPRPPVGMTEAGVQLRSLDDLGRFAQMVHDSKLAPRAFESPQAIAVAVQAGMELGFSPLRSLSAVYVVNGRPGLYGEAALAKIRQSGLLAPGTDIETGVAGAGEERVGYCRSQRRGAPRTVEHQFSIADAKRAGIWEGKGSRSPADSPWTKYPNDMLTWRAVSRHAKAQWSDVLLGLEIAEIIEDYPPMRIEPKVPAGPDPLLEEV